jgi:NADH-quinone oxidoreductase subunit J
MSLVFYISAFVAIVSTVFVITRTNVMHALLYLIVSLLAVALMFFVLGAPFVAALEVIVYAGAIMVLFIFAIMLLNLGPQSSQQEKAWLQASAWRGPAVLAFILLVELVTVLASGQHGAGAGVVVDPKQVGISLFGPYLIGVELASILLLASIVGAYHLGQRAPAKESAANLAESIPAPQTETPQPTPEAEGMMSQEQGGSTRP